jgi:acyl-CoA synthetase (NDP forming)
MTAGVREESCDVAPNPGRHECDEKNQKQEINSKRGFRASGERKKSWERYIREQSN